MANARVTARSTGAVRPIGNRLSKSTSGDKTNDSRIASVTGINTSRARYSAAMMMTPTSRLDRPLAVGVRAGATEGGSACGTGETFNGCGITWIL